MDASLTPPGSKDSKGNELYSGCCPSPLEKMENNNRKILALKYRPQNFQSILGQDVMVQTIINSIKLNRVANAFLLTGIRGTGKTSTARILSKALVCAGNFIQGEKCKKEDDCL